ncbi:hypothetical protein NDU88_002123 [Pleurodeles waltl]|uniref:Uncharacterized protein n=1 Tax=Pleurodeles waltl TaxID=8319 RepID=A0AAV7TKR8_PLEWA|nr:hypothetical protein NDU88_002123 [Pleurodeles waltl]
MHCSGEDAADAVSKPFQAPPACEKTYLTEPGTLAGNTCACLDVMTGVELDLYMIARSTKAECRQTRNNTGHAGKQAKYAYVLRPKPHTIYSRDHIKVHHWKPAIHSRCGGHTDLAYHQRCCQMPQKSCLDPYIALPLNHGTKRSCGF